jgi:abortive infection bacteriophage resistance protein
VYYVLCIIQYLLKTIDPTPKFADNIKNLLTDFPNVNLTAMGFPKDWQKETLWK